MRAIAWALVGVFGGPASAADLMDVFRQAQRSDATYAAARSSWAAIQERVPQGRAGLFPLASLTASSQYNDRSTRFRDGLTPRTDADFTATSVSLQVTQPLYRRQNVIAYEQSLTQAGQADAQLALAAQELILRAAQAYFDVLLAQDNVAFAEAQKVAIAEQLEQAKRNFELGNATITDTHEAQARYDLTVAQAIAAHNDVELRQRALQQLLGRAAPPLAPLGPRFALKTPEPATMDAWVDLAQQANLQVRIARSALEFAAQDVDRNRAAHYPTLDAVATVSGVGAGPALTGGPRSDTRTTSVGVQLVVPLYQGGALNARVREAIAVQARSGDELEAARRTAEFNARQAFLGITSGIAQVRALEAAVVSTQSQLESTRLGQKVGVRTQVDVLNAQQLLFSAARDLAKSKYDYILSLLRLEAAIGELTEDDLGAVNQWLDRDVSAVSQRDLLVSAIAPPPTVATAPAAPDDTARVLDTLQAWARAWSSNDVAGYLAHYDAAFQTPRGLSRSAWEAERAARIRKPRAIEVAIETPSVKLEGPDRALVTFRQEYRSGALAVSSDKSLVMGKTGERWLIREERILAERQR